ncbi:ParA family protein [Singulisphaera sp. PoT]|uniref:ParA family protein n=1 Tax=Singulisphaera sp. PoT TaxID=3411797 RepID=UPI003BF4F14D
MSVISSIALKGGVGKTTLTHHLAGVLSGSGKRILLIDNDAQGSLSSGVFGPTAVESMEPSATIAALYGGLDPLPEQVILSTGIERLDIVAGSMAAARFNVPEPHLAPIDVQLCLRNFLDEVRGLYDLVLIDNPPNLNAASWAALIASDHIIVPVIPEDYGAASLSPVFESLALVRSGPNPKLNLLGLVLSMVQPRLTVHQLYEASLREQHGKGVLTSRIPLATDIKEAISQRRPISLYKPKGASTKAFKALAEEMLARMEEASNPSNLEAA